MFYEETLSAREVMRPHAITTRPSERVFELTKTMLKRRLRAVPVVGKAWAAKGKPQPKGGSGSGGAEGPSDP